MEAKKAEINSETINEYLPPKSKPKKVYRALHYFQPKPLRMSKLAKWYIMYIFQTHFVKETWRVHKSLHLHDPSIMQLGSRCMSKKNAGYLSRQKNADMKSISHKNRTSIMP